MRQRSLICPAVAVLAFGLCFSSAPAGSSTPKDTGGVASWLISQAQQNLEDGRDNLKGFMTARTQTYDQLRECYEGTCLGDPDSPDQGYLANATADFRGALSLPGFEQPAREGLGEAVCWHLKGQALVGNDDLVTALGLRYGATTPTLQEEIDALDAALAGYTAGTDLFPELIDCPDCFTTDACLEGSGEVDCPYCSGYVAREVWVDLLARKVHARVEKADRLFAMGMDSPLKKAEAEEEIRRAVQEGYLGAAVLGVGMDEDQIGVTNLNRLHASVVRLEKTFERIASGLDAAGFHDDYVPFLPYHDCNPDRSLRDIADDVINDINNGALYWETQAKATSRQCDVDETELADALQAIRQGVKSDLDDLCGYITDTHFPGGVGLDDPAVVQAFLEDCLAGPSELQEALLANEEAFSALETAFTELNNVWKKIEIEQDRVGQIAKVYVETAEDLGALEIAKGFANAYSFSTQVEIAVPPSMSVTVNFNPGSIISGFLDAEARMLEAMQAVRIEGIDSAATIKLYLLEMAEKAKALREYELRISQSQVTVENLTNQARALVDEWWRSRDGLATSYFSNPAYRLEMENAVSRAYLKLGSAQRWSYLASRALSYDWSLPYDGTEAADVEPSCSDFESPRSVFSLNTALDVNDFFDCLGFWAAYNFSEYGPLNDDTHTTISVREDILGLKDHNECLHEDYPDEVKAENIRLFKEFIQDHTVGSLITFEFATSISDESFFDIFIVSGVNIWNAKLSHVACNLVGSDDLNPAGATKGNLGLTLGGMSTVRRPDADWGPPGDPCLGIPDDASGDLFVHYDLEDFGAHSSLRTVYIDAHINGFPEEPVEPDWSLGLARLSIGAQRWQVTINKAGADNSLLDWDELEDVKLMVKWRYGQPPYYDCSMAESDPGAMDWELEE